ncbi:MAG: hypothetical protein ACK5RG_09810 [Cyclobacteriaceae bacterium]|jgi:hypothetical protein
MKSQLNRKTKILIGLETITFIGFMLYWFINPILSTILLILLLYDLKSKADRVIVTDDGIVVSNWLTSQKRHFSWRQFDQIVVYFDILDPFNRHNLFIRKGSMLVCKVDGKNFTNLPYLLIEIERKRLKALSN